MRILQCYRFPIGTKIPFDKWPSIIEQFLQEQNLHHRYFHYYLESYGDPEKARSIMDGSRCETCKVSAEWACERCRQNAAELLRKGTSCERALKENPFLGAITTHKDQYDKFQSLNNYSEESNSSKEKIYAILSKIYRRYGFSETKLIYRDIDFFSRRVSTPAPEYGFGDYYGSGITLCRSCLSQDNEILLVVESRYPGEVPDTTTYADALGKLLPGIKRQSVTKVLMEDGDQARYDELHHQAKPLIKQAKDFFIARMPEEKGNDAPETQVSVASWLKKLSKRYGYDYLGYSDYAYLLEKKLPAGHSLCLEFLSSPSCPSADPGVKLTGLGFSHEIWGDEFAPQNAQDAADYFTKLFDTLAQAESSVFPAILDLYPDTPDWFMPTH